jgi:hypothetical protein
MAKLTKLIAVAGLAVLAGCPLPAPVSRPPGPDGTARWAWAIAQPVIQGLASDAQLRGIHGLNVFTDGRLPANIGAWSFITWSPGQNRKVQVTVNASGGTSTVFSDSEPQGPTLNASWADSPQVLAATNGHRDPSASLVNLMVLGYGQPGAAGDAAWGINFNAGTNQIVRWNGTYIGEG